MSFNVLGRLERNVFRISIMNILIIASRYPQMDTDDNKGTIFLHSYAAEWAKKGNNVRVFHTKPKFPQIVEHLIKIATVIFRRSKELIEFNQFHMKGTETEYVHNDVKIVRLMVKKYLPKTICGRKSIEETAAKIAQYIKNDKFKPDIILVDFINPAMMIANIISYKLNLPTVVILHETDFQYLKSPITAKQSLIELQKAFYIAFRSIPAKNDFERFLYKSDNYMIMYSGVPDDLIIEKEKIKHRTQIRNFISVGRFIKRKHYDVVISAFDKTSKNKPYKLTLIGYGAEEANLKNLAKSLDSKEQITFIGKIPREEVLYKMQDADVFILIPHNETFGMVYIEAMSRGCLVIGAKGTGVDGIIKNNVNGWLVEPGNEKELIYIIKKIVALSSDEIAEISQNAYETSVAMSDSSLADQMIINFEKCVSLYKKKRSVQI